MEPVKAIGIANAHSALKERSITQKSAQPRLAADALRAGNDARPRLGFASLKCGYKGYHAET